MTIQERRYADGSGSRTRSVAGSALLLVAAAAVAALFLLVPPIAQDPGYHLFADTRPCGALSNCADVVSNVPFAVVGLLGLVASCRRRQREQGPFTHARERRPYIVFFAGATLTAAGSAWYHLAPDNARLFWDRLPMAIGFAGLLAAVLTERLQLSADRLALALLLGAAVGSVFYWTWSEQAGAGDLRPYLVVQFGSLVAVIALLVLYPPRYTGTGWFAAGLSAYAAAKVFEVADHAIFASAGVSGHTLKHLAAAGGIACIVLMLAARRPLAAATGGGPAAATADPAPEPAYGSSAPGADRTLDS